MNATLVNPPQPGELPAAAGATPHGVAALSITTDGQVIALCVCALLGYGDTEEEARADLACAHQEANPA